MARSLRLTKPERTLVHEWMTLVAANEEVRKPDRRAAQSVIDKLDASELLTTKRSGGAALSTPKALDAFRSVLGTRLIVPLTPGKLFWITMARGLGTLGADETQCRLIATIAGATWKGPIKAESLVRQGATLLAAGFDPVCTPTTSDAGTDGLLDEL